MTEFIGELEALDQPVADLLVPRLALVTGEALAKGPYGIAEWGCVELRPTTFGPLVSRMVLHIVSEVFSKRPRSCNSHSTDAFSTAA